MRTREELAWLAGFWDGEGCVYSMKIKYYNHPVFVLGQAGDEGEALCQKVLDTAQVGGKVNGPWMGGTRTKPYWMARASGYERVQALLAMCWPWLSETKRSQAIRVLKASRELLVANDIRRAKDRLSCRHGHPYDEKNTYVTAAGHRRCRRCHADGENRRRKERLARAEDS